MNTELPFFSIVSVVKNNAAGLEVTLRSIHAQSIAKTMYEVIVIDCASTDNTKEIVKCYAPSIFISEQDTGIYDAMNKGIQYCTGKWVYFLNGGDRLADATILKKLHQYCAAPLEKQQGNMQKKTILCAPVRESYRGSYITRHPVPFTKMPMQMPASHQGTMIETNTMKHYMFDTSYKICADAELFARLKHDKHAICFFSTVLAQIDGEGYSNKHWKLFLQERKRIQKKYFPSCIAFLQLHCYIATIHVKKLLRFLLPQKLFLFLRSRMQRRKKTNTKL